MPYWLTNPDHGVMPVYDMGDVERNKAHGWTLLNVGESPVFEPEQASEVLREVRETMQALGEPKRKPGRPKKAA
jgi:hypothetical protein